MTLEQAEAIILSQTIKCYKLEKEIEKIRGSERFWYEQYKKEEQINKDLINKPKLNVETMLNNY